MSLSGREGTLLSKQPFQMSFWKKKCLSVCLLDFFESADTRDLGLMTLFLFFSQVIALHHCFCSRSLLIDRVFFNQEPCLKLIVISQKNHLMGPTPLCLRPRALLIWFRQSTCQICDCYSFTIMDVLLEKAKYSFTYLLRIILMLFRIPSCLCFFKVLHCYERKRR